MRFFSEMFYRLCGMRMGKGVRINSYLIMDPSMVEIGDNSTVGLGVYVRKGRKIPPGSRITSLSGMDARGIHDLERGRGVRRVPGG